MRPRMASCRGVGVSFPVRYAHRLSPASCSFQLPLGWVSRCLWAATPRWRGMRMFYPGPKVKALQIRG